MRITDVIRALLDKIDDLEAQVDANQERFTQDDEMGRFRSIMDILNNPDIKGYSNTPNEMVTDIDSVTTDAGGGVNGPKHHHDIRIKDPSMYPDKQEY